jgi:predicted nucleic acid-binding protein
MTAKSFADSNVVLYTIGKDVRKAGIARRLVSEQPVISTQVVNECVSVCLRKLSFTREQAYAFARELMDRTEVLPLDESTIDRAATLAIRYQLSHWDALIVASAALAGCEVLYSEDLQDGQVFDQLKVVNPFL